MKGKTTMHRDGSITVEVLSIKERVPPTKRDVSPLGALGAEIASQDGALSHEGALAFAYVWENDPEAADLFLTEDSSEALVIKYAELLKQVRRRPLVPKAQA